MVLRKGPDAADSCECGVWTGRQDPNQQGFSEPVPKPRLTRYSPEHHNVAG